MSSRSGLSLEAYLILALAATLLLAYLTTPALAAATMGTIVGIELIRRYLSSARRRRKVESGR